MVNFSYIKSSRKQAINRGCFRPVLWRRLDADARAARWLGGKEKGIFESCWMKRFFCYCWFGAILEKDRPRLGSMLCYRVRCVVEICFFAFAAKLLTQ